MTIAGWDTTTIDGVDYYVMPAVLRVSADWDPSSAVFVAVAAPDAGVAGFPAMAKGDTGDTPTIDDTVNLTPLAWDDPTPDSASFTETSPDVYQLGLSLHMGEPGTDGTTLLDPDAYGSPVYKKILIVNATADGFVYQSQKVGDRVFPTTISSTPSGNAGYTLCSVGVAAQDFDWRPECYGECVVTGTGADVRVNLVARLQVGATSAETSGNIVARARGVAGQNPPTHTLIPGLFPGTYPPSDSFDKVPAGSNATIYLRAERQSGIDTFTTSSTDTSFYVRVCPIP